MRRIVMEERVMHLIAEVQGEPDGEYIYREGIQLNEDYLFDSLRVVEFISRIEDEFGFEFNLDEFDIDSIYDLDSVIATIKNETN